MKVMGLICGTHDAGVAIVEDGTPRIILEEERLNREKHTQQFPRQSLDAVFRDGSLSLADIDVITTPWDPRRIRGTFLKAVFGKFPASLSMVLDASHPTQDSNIIFLNPWIRRALKRQFRDQLGNQTLPPIVNVGHHESHAAIYFVSPFDDATVIVMDGYGDDSATSVFTGEGNRLERQWHGRFFDSLGMVYTLITCHLGFEVFEEGTVMALAACGSDRLVDRMRDIVHLEPDGRFSINMDYFSHDKFGMLRPFKRKFAETFGPTRRRDEPLTDHHRDLARALQSVTEDVVLHVAQQASRRYPSRNLCFVGGVALNCVANGRILQETDFERLWVPPCASDTGVPLGSTLWHTHQTLGQPRTSVLTHAFHGLEYNSEQIRTALEAAGLKFEKLELRELTSRVAQDLADNRIVGWFQGRYEIGPRALGNRSILASPLTTEIRDLINARVKFREPFRPFAPAVLQEYAADYFEITQPDPFMTSAPKVRPEMASRIPAAVHVDGTARIQTVDRQSNPRYYDVIEAFMKLTGVPVVLNTSFNKQEPVVTRPEEAISCFLRTDMDVLVMGDFYCTDRPAAAAEKARASFDILDVNLRGGE